MDEQFKSAGGGSLIFLIWSNTRVFIRKLHSIFTAVVVIGFIRILEGSLREASKRHLGLLQAYRLDEQFAVALELSACLATLFALQIGLARLDHERRIRVSDGRRCPGLFRLFFLR